MSEKMEEEDFFELKKWRIIRDKPKQIKNNNEVQQIEELKCIFQLSESLLDQEKLSKLKSDQKDFFINDFLLPFIKDLMLYKYQSEQVYLISLQILQKFTEVISHFIPNDIIKQTEVFKLIFDSQKFYYKNHCQDETDNRITGILYQPEQQRLEWLNTLKQGDLIDAVKKEKHYNKQCWSRAVILHKLQDQNDVKVGFLGDYEKYDIYFSLNSFEIAPIGTMSDDFEWRINLNVGDLIDVCDTAHIWYNSTILQKMIKQGDRGHDIIEIKIGYRVFSENGDKEDLTQGKKYFGWSERYDDWFTVTSPRLAQFNKMAKKLFKRSSQANIEEIIDDSKDIIYEKIYKQEKINNSINKFCAVMRFIENKSYAHVNIINNFYRIGGFDRIIQRISDSNNRIPFEILVNYIQGIGQLYQYYFRDYAHEFIPGLFFSVKKYILEAPDNILKTFDKDKIDLIFKYLGLLQRRVISVGETRHAMETFYQQTTLKCFRCDFLQVQVIAIKMLQQIIKNMDKDVYLINYNQLKQWITDQNIFGLIFQNNSHAQFIALSSELLKFMLIEDMIHEQQLEYLWKLQLDDFETIEKTQAYFRIFKESAGQFKQLHVETVLKLISQLSSKFLQKEHLELIQDIFGKNNNNKTQQNILTALNCLWQILMIDNKKVNKQASEKALEQFLQLTKSLEQKEERYGFILRCIKNIESNNVTQSSIQIMKQIIESYPQKQIEENIETQGQIILKICQENNIVQVILQNIEKLKQDAQNYIQTKIQNANEKDIEDFNKIYLEKLEIRVNFIRFMNSMLTKENAIVNFKFLSDLWDQLIVKSLILEEKDLMFKWLRDFDKEKNQNIEEIVTFFKEKVVKNTEILKNLTVNGFECFKQLLIAINLQQNKLSLKKIIRVDRNNDLIEDKPEEITSNTDQQAVQQANQQENTTASNNNDTNNTINNNQVEQNKGFETSKQQNETKQQIFQKKDSQGKVVSLTNAPPIDTSNNYNAHNNNNNNSNEEKYFDFDYQSEIHPNSLEGVGMLWMMVENVSDKNVVEKCAEFLTKLFLNLSTSLEQQTKEIRQQYIDYCTKNLQQYQQILQQSNSKLSYFEREQIEQKIGRQIMMIKVFLCDSEKYGISGIKSHSGLVKGEVLTFSITNELSSSTYNQEIPKKFDLKIYSNRTILDLRVEIAKKIKVTWDQIKLKRTGLFTKDITDQDNGRTIGEIRFKTNENLTVTKRATQPIPNAQLLDKDGLLMEKPKQIFCDLFKVFSKNGFMDDETCGKFISAATKDFCPKDDSRVKEVINQWDDDKDGLMTEQNFLSFYHEACVSRKYTVYSNLLKLNYRPDFKRIEEIGVDDIVIENLPCYFLMNNQKFYLMLFDLISLIENKDIISNLKGILQHLPSSQLILKQVINLEGIKNTENPNWQLIFDEGSHFKLLYVLTIIEYLMEDEEEDLEQQNQEESKEKKEQQNDSKEITQMQQQQLEKQQLQLQLEQQQKLLEEQSKKNQKLNSQQEIFQAVKNSDWRSDFVFLGGFEQLFKVFQKLVQKEKLSMAQKNILSFILKIIKNYFTAALGKIIPHIYQIVNYTRLTAYNLDTINENLKENEEDYEKSLQQQQNQQKEMEIEINIINNQQQNKNLQEKAQTAEEQKQQQQKQNQVDEKTQKRLKLKLKESKEYLQLVEKLHGNLGNKILQTLDLNSLVNFIVNLINQILNSKTDVESEDRLIIDYGMSIITGILVYSDECLQFLIFINNFQQDNTLFKFHALIKH